MPQSVSNAAVSKKLSELLGPEFGKFPPEGYDVVAGPKSVKLLSKDDGEVVASHKVDLGTLMEAKPNGLTAAAIKKMMKKFKTTESELDTPPSGFTWGGKIKVGITPTGPSAPAEPPHPNPADGTFGVAPGASAVQVCSDLNKQPVKLTEASMIYQPVKGTGAGSTYFAVMIGSAANIAARWKSNGVLSVRVEGHLPKAAVEALVEAGLDVAGGAHHSVHTSPGTDTEALMVVAAVAGVLSPWAGWKHAPVNWPPIIKGLGE